MFFRLPPAGDPVLIGPGGTTLEEVARPYRVTYYGAGTSALAAAMVAARRVKEVVGPEVILPGYGCPDLVSAAAYAGLRPVLVDLEAGRPWMDLSDLGKKISKRTVAIVAVHLFGIPERVKELRNTADEHDSVLIEDCAQTFPASASNLCKQGDYVILSFGRGKPVSILGGGAVLSRDAAYEGFLPEVVPLPALSAGEGLRFYGRVLAYNLLRHPRMYWLPASLPGLRLGETRYRALHRIAPMSPLHRSVLPCNIAAYRDRDDHAQAALAAGMRNVSEGVVDLARMCCGGQQPRLLRYPVLVPEPALRGRILGDLLRHGLGVSAMYRKPLNEVEGMRSLLGQDWRLPAASAFAAALITLPTHQSVRPADLCKMIGLIEKALSMDDR